MPVKRRFLLCLAAILWGACGVVPDAAAQQGTCLRPQGTATQLVVCGQPFLILGGELGNSSASCPDDIDRIFPRLQRMGLNTVLVPAYWDLTEPVEGVFDFSLTDKVIETARACHLRVIFLWFGAWKNSMSCYAPGWFKADCERYPRARTRSGKPLEMASAFSEAVLEADARAFTRWMEHLAEVDGAQGTVVMIQIENETGMLEDARDYAAGADEAFHADVPRALLAYLQENKATLHPQMLAKWEGQGCPTRGDWQRVFGSDLFTDELFMAWHYARYVERLAQSARSILNLPLYVNAAMNSRGRLPGQYPSGGPLAHLIDVWHCAAPDIDILAPDLYDAGFTDWTAQYKLPDNPLFIPEIRLDDNDGVRAFYVFGEHDAIGFSPFSIEDGSDETGAPLVQSYAKLRELMPLILSHQGRGTMWGLLLDQEQRERIVEDDDLTITCRHYFTLPWDPRATDGSPWGEGGGLLIRLARGEYLLAGSGVVVEFAKGSETAFAEGGQERGEDGFVLAGGSADGPLDGARWEGMRCGIASVDEVSVGADGSLTYLRRMNGDQTHQGRHARIAAGDWAILHIKLYEYQ